MLEDIEMEELNNNPGKHTQVSRTKANCGSMPCEKPEFSVT